MKNIIRGIKLLLVIVLGLFIFVQVRQPSLSEAEFDTVSQTVLVKMEEYGLEKQDNISIKKYLGLQPDEYENIIYYKSADPMDVREIVLVQFKDVQQQDAFKQMIQTRIDAQINAFDGYGVDQVALLKKSVVSLDMNYALYVTSENCEEVYKLYKSQL